MTGPGRAASDLDVCSADDMLAYARTALDEWADTAARTAAEQRASRKVAFALRRLMTLAAAGQLPDEWRAALLANYPPGG